MSKPILMPQVGQDLTEGKLIELRVKLGDQVSKGDIVAVVESEKASFEVEAFEAGTVVDIRYKEGDTTEVLAPLMFVGQAGAPAAAGLAPNSVPPSPEPSSRAAATATIAPGEAPATVAAAAAPNNATNTDAAARAESGAVADEPPPSGKTVRSSPLARRRAGASGLDIGNLSGTGPRGAVVSRDIDLALKTRQPAAAPARSPDARMAPPPVDARPAPAATPTPHVSVPPASAGSLHRVWLRKGEGDPVVMIHGFGADHNAWRVLAAGAGLSRPILALDLPGHGRSSASGPVEFDAIVAAVATALAEEGVTAADLVGHSLGAAVAVALAEAARFTVRSLFLISPGGLGPDINGEFVSGFARARSEASLAPWMKLLVADEGDMGAAFVRVTAETRAMPGISDAQERLAKTLFPDGTQSFSVRKALDGLAVPTRIVFGQADRVIPARHAAGLSGTVGVHLFPNVGHMPQLEAREPVARLLAEHLRSVA